MGMKMARKMDFGLTRKMGETRPKNGKHGPKFHFRTILGPFFSIFRAIFLISQAVFPPFFSGEAKIHFSAHFCPHFGPAILGPEMAAPILWTPGKNAFFLQEQLPCPLNSAFQGGGGNLGLGGGGVPILFLWARGFF